MDFQIEFWRQNTDVVKFLLEHSEGIELNVRNNNGDTALMIAQQRGYQDIVQMIKTFYFFLSLFSLFQGGYMY